MSKRLIMSKKKLFQFKRTPKSLDFIIDKFKHSRLFLAKLINFDGLKLILHSHGWAYFEEYKKSNITFSYLYIQNKPSKNVIDKIWCVLWMCKVSLRNIFYPFSPASNEQITQHHERDWGVETVLPDAERLGAAFATLYPQYLL